jgi:hypothetical protein
LLKRVAEKIRNPLIPSRIFAVYDPDSPAISLGELSARLLAEQKASWPQLAAGCSSLKSVRTREVQCEGYSAWLQFNPGRIVSTSAKVDEQSISARLCFLCPEHLPLAQKGILYRDNFLVLCNPAPIFSEHFTISHQEHIPQSFTSHVKTFLGLARDSSPGLTLFYNGPKCGASAPDHLHFQASPQGKIPVEMAAQERDRRVRRKNVRGVDVLTLSNFGREVIVLESSEASNLERVLIELVETFRTLIGTSEEPMMNVLCSYENSSWRVILFPRSKHRPDVYFKDEAERVLISPAAVDIGGLVITPLEKDYNTVSARIIEDVFREVSLAKKQVDELINNLS